MFNSTRSAEWFPLIPTVYIILQDVNREVDQIKFDIQDMQRWRDRFFLAIHSGNVTTVSNNR